MKYLLLALTAVGLLGAAPASKSWESLSQLKPGDPIEVVTRDRSEKGEFVANSTESITIRTSRQERKFLRPEIERVVLRAHPRRARNILICVGIGAGISLAADQTIGRFLRNEGNPPAARPLIWTIPIALGFGIGAALPSYPVIYQK